jgi:hypothetical protein
MQTIDNIKKGLECYAQDRSYMLPCSDCAYHGAGLPHCRKAVHEDALALIEQLEKTAFMQNMVILGKQDVITKQERVRSNLQEEIWQLKQQVPKWISVEERLPEENTEVMMVLFGKVCIGDYLWSGSFESQSGSVWHAGDGQITHWMPLPDAPEEDAE